MVVHEIRKNKFVLEVNIKILKQKERERLPRTVAQIFESMSILWHCQRRRGFRAIALFAESAVGIHRACDMGIGVC